MPKEISYTIDPLDVRWTMDWRKRDGTKDPKFADKPDTEEVYEEPGMVAVLAANDQLFMFPDSRTGGIGIYLNMNDMFAWACADAEEIKFDELKDVYQHFERDPAWGTVIWTSKKRRMLPQTPVLAKMLEDGVDIDALMQEIEELKSRDQESQKEEAVGQEGAVSPEDAG